MSNGYLIAAGADLAAAQEIGAGFGLEIVDPATVGDAEAAGAAYATAANLGVLLSAAAAQDAAFVALLQSAAKHTPRAQLILVDADARAAFPFLPEAWPAMSLDEARSRAAALLQQSQPQQEQQQQEQQQQTEQQPEQQQQAQESEAAPAPPAAEEPAEESMSPPMSFPSLEQPGDPSAPPGWMADGTTREADGKLSLPGGGAETEGAPMPAAPPQAQPAPAPMAPAPPQEQPWGPHGPEAQPPASPVPRDEAGVMRAGTSSPEGQALKEALRGAKAPADATAFAPKKLRRGSPELVRIVLHQPKDLKDVIKAARKIDPSAQPAPQGMKIGDIEIGADIGVALEVRGASCDGALQRRKWQGAPLDFSFAVEADEDAKQAVIMARVFVNDAQIGVIAFIRPISGPKKKPADAGKGERMRKIKRVFLSYSSQDREIVSAIATAYESAGVPHFWDRASLKSGEEWSPRLRKEIDRADLFHLCWSKSAAASEWVEKETEHALTRRKRSNGKQPDITVQMLDGPPWAPHPAQLDSINFDDFVRAAIVGYARGQG